MKSIIRYIFTCILLCGAFCGLASCESDVEFRGEQMAPQLVLYAVVTANTSPSVYLSESRFFLDGDNVYKDVLDATVKLFVDGAETEDLVLVERKDSYGNPTGDHYYRASTILRSGDRVEFRASCKRLGATVAGSTVIPAYPEVGDMYFNYVNTDKGDSSGLMVLPLSDPESQANYYWLAAGATVWYGKGDYDYYTQNLSFSDVAFTGGDVLDVVGGIFDVGYGSNIFFDDTIINGRNPYPLQIEFDLAVEYLPTTEFWSELYHIDEHLYSYLRSVKLASGETLFGEPVQIYSNVEGGMGLVASRSTSVRQSLWYEEGGKP